MLVFASQLLYILKLYSVELFSAREMPNADSLDARLLALPLPLCIFADQNAVN